MIRFGAFEVDPDAGELRKHGLKIRLADQPFSILVLLLERPGKVVTREALQRRLWADDTFVDFERGLNKAVNRLRDALGDSADAPRYIETIPKRGYRFIGVVDPPSSAHTQAPPLPEPPVPESAAPRHHLRTTVVLGSVALLALIALLFFPRQRPSAGGPLVRSSVLPPADATFVPYNFALAPDGRHLAFVASDRAGNRALWLRALSAVDPRPLKGTDGAGFPFWAPDNQRIGFFADRKLLTVDITSGAVQTLAEARRPSGGTWNPDDVIVFAPDVNGPLYRVPAGGGPAAAVTTISDREGGEGHRWPSFLPDGRHVLYVSDSRNPERNVTGIFVAALESDEHRQVSSEAVRSVAFARDHLFFARGSMLIAQPFDPVRLRSTGDQVSIAERGVATASAFFPSGFSVSQTGLLAFQSSSDLATRLTWMDTDGRELGRMADETYGDPSISPDGRLVAVSCALHDGRLAVCVFDLARGLATRITSGPEDRYPVWSPDGREIAYLSSGDVYRVSADGSTPPRRVTRRGNPTSWSRDGRILLFGSKDGVVSLAVSALDGTLTELGPGSEGHVSPDGTWLVHNSEDGILARRFPEFGPPVQIARFGGHQPRWSRDGRRIFYITLDKMLMAVDFDPVRATASAPHALFETRIVNSAFAVFQYDIAPDGRLLINTLTSSAPPLTLVTGWAETLRR